MGLAIDLIVAAALIWTVVYVWQHYVSRSKQS